MYFNSYLHTQTCRNTVFFSTQNSCNVIGLPSTFCQTHLIFRRTVRYSDPYSDNCSPKTMGYLLVTQHDKQLQTNTYNLQADQSPRVSPQYSHPERQRDGRRREGGRGRGRVRCVRHPLSLSQARLNKAVTHRTIPLESCVGNRSDRCTATPIISSPRAAGAQGRMYRECHRLYIFLMN